MLRKPLLFFLLCSLSNITAAAIGTSITPIGLNGYYSYAPSALQAQIQKQVAGKQYKEAIASLDQQLSRDPTNISLLYQKADIYSDIGQYDNAIDVLNKIVALKPDDQKAKDYIAKLNLLKEKIPHNEVGLGQYETYVSDIGHYWSITSLHYYRFTDKGTFGGRVNYGHRYGQSGEQYVLEAYPKSFNGNVTTNLTYGWSNTSQQVFPKYQYTIEPYLSLPKGIEISVGQRFIRDFGVNIYNNTESIGKYFSDYFIWFRPNHYSPSAKNYYEIGLKRFFTGLNYVSIRVGAGKYPDIGDLPPLNEIIILKAKNIGLDGQYGLSPFVYVKANVGYTDQTLPGGTKRKLTDAGLELDWRF